MKALISLLLFITAAPLFSQVSQEIQKELKSFNRIIASNKVNVILQKGDRESIRLVYARVSPDKINIKVINNTLRIFLDDARVYEPTEKIYNRENHIMKRSIYADAEVTAYVTYNELKHVQIRGNQELSCEDLLEAKKFTLKAYGENEISLAALKTRYFKASLYGENDLKVNGGKAMDQKYRLFGENRIDTRDLKSYSTVTNIYGESKLKITTADHLKVNSFGESEVSYTGDAEVDKGLVFGRADIRRID